MYRNLSKRRTVWFSGYLSVCGIIFLFRGNQIKIEVTYNQTTGIRGRWNAYFSWQFCVKICREELSRGHVVT